MRFFLVVSAVLFSQFASADVPDLSQAKKCVLDHAGVVPELQSCIGKAVSSAAKESEEAEKCDSKGNCVVYIKCELKEGPKRFKVEGNINYHPILAKAPSIIGDLMECQMLNLSASETADQD